MSLFITDTSVQSTNTITAASTSTTNPNILLFQDGTSGIYNPSSNVIKIYTNNTDALTVDSSQNIICNGSLITNLNYNNIKSNKPTNFQSDRNSTIINKPTNFQSDWSTTIINKPDLTVYLTSVTANNTFATIATVSDTNVFKSNFE